MKRKEIINKVEASLLKYDSLKNVSEQEVGYTKALQHFLILLSNKTK
jgi:hypothetical protein